MKILFIYPNSQGYGRIPLGVAIIMTILQEEWHEVALFDTTYIFKSENANNLFLEKAKMVLPTDTSHLYDPHSEEEIAAMLNRKIKEFSPDLLAISILEDNYNFADYLLTEARKINKNIPVIAGGSTPTVAPDVIIENPNIDYVIQGEGEEAMREFCALLEEGRSIEKVRNLCYKKAGRVINNPLRPYINMDELPVQSLELWDKKHLVRAYSGKLYTSGYFEMSRGCLNRCSYCINGACQRLLKEAGSYFRAKSVGKAIAEIKHLKSKYNLEMAFFCDDNFLLKSKQKMEEFAAAWKAEISLPYWINCTVESLCRDKLAILKETGCCGIGIGIESGSEWLRQNILRRRITNKKIEEGFNLVKEYTIRTTANNIIGFPGESEEDLFETIKLNKAIHPASIMVAFVAPYIGTAIHSVVKELGYIDVWDKPGFKGMCKEIYLRRGSVINNPYLDRDRLTEIFFNFMDYAEGRMPIPDKFLKPAPGSNDIAAPRGVIGKEVVDTFNRLIKNGLLNEC